MFARLRIDTVVERDLQDLRRVQVPRQQIGLLAEGTHLDTTGTAALAGILQRLPLTHELLDIGVRIEDRGIAMSLADDLDTSQQELIGGILCDVDREAWLQFVQFLLNLQNHVGELIGSTIAFTIHTTDIDIGKVIICSRLQGRHTHLWRCRLIVELDPQTRNQFLCLVTGQRTVSKSLLIERPQVLVDMSGIHRVPAIQFRDSAKVYEPVHLDGLP